jgi:hypothetical protein
MREASIATIVQKIEATKLNHPTRVAIDGRTASGETALASPGPI